MSSRVIRNWFREQLVARVPGIPFYETVNIEPVTKNMPDIWATLEFGDASDTRVSLGRRATFRETGTVGIVVVGKSGLGDGAVIDASELYRAQFFGIHIPVPLLDGSGENGYLYLDLTDPPNTDISENGNWFIANVSCNYQFDSVRGTA